MSHSLEFSADHEEPSTQRGYALYDYAAQEDDEVSIQAHQDFVLVETYDDDWWLVNVAGRVGVVPSNYVELYPTDGAPSSSSSPVKKHSNSQQQKAILPRSTSKGLLTPNGKVKTGSGLFHPEAESPMIDTSVFPELISPPPKQSQHSPKDKAKQKKANKENKTPVVDDFYESSELVRLRNLREEASVKIDALRNTVTHLENQQPPLSANNSMHQLPHKSSKMNGIAGNDASYSDTESGPSDALVVRKSASTKRLTPSSSNATGLIQQVTLDPTSIEYISRVINEKIQREFTLRDQKLIRQVHDIVNQSFLQFQQQQKQIYHPLISPHSSVASENIHDTPMSLPSHSRMLKAPDEYDLLLANNPHQNKPSSSNRAVMTKKQQEQMEKHGPTKIPKIRLPKVNNFTDQQQKKDKQPTSSRSTKSNMSDALPPIHGGGGAIGGGNQKNKGNNYNNNNPAMLQNKPVKEEMLSMEGVQYPPCRSVVYPSGQDIALGRHRHLLTPTKLNLRHIFGYDGDINRHGGITKGKNVVWLRKTSKIAYPAASMVVVCDLSLNNQQSFFTGHTDDVVALCQHPTQPLIASSQVGVGLILIWNYERLANATHANPHLQQAVSIERPDYPEIVLPNTVRGVSCVDFSPDGRFLLACSMEEIRSVYIYDWKKSTFLTSAKVGHIENCQFLFNPYCYTAFEEESNASLHAQGHSLIKSNKGQILPPTGCYTLTSFGGKQVKFWTLKATYTSPNASSNNNAQANERDYRGKQFKQKVLKHVLEGTQGSVSRKQQNTMDFTSCCFIPLASSSGSGECRILLGTSTGAIHIWQHLPESASGLGGLEDDFLPPSWMAKGKLMMIVTDAHESPIVDLDFYCGSGMNDTSDRVLSTDQSGIVNVWQVNPAVRSKEGMALEHMGGMQLDDSYGRSIAFDDEGQRIILGTANNSIFMMTMKPAASDSEEGGLSFDISPILTSHNGKVRKLAVHPIIDSIFASISNDRTIQLWDGNDRQHLTSIDLEFPATAICFSTDGMHLAIGNDRCELLILSSTQFQEYVNQRVQQLQKSMKKSKKAPVAIEVPSMDWQLVDSRVIAAAGGK